MSMPIIVIDLFRPAVSLQRSIITVHGDFMSFSVAGGFNEFERLKFISGQSLMVMFDFRILPIHNLFWSGQTKDLRHKLVTHNPNMTH